MPQFVDIAQLAVAVSDRPGRERSAREVLGFPSERSDDGAVTYCRIDGHHRRLALTDGPPPVLPHVAFDVVGGDVQSLELVLG